MQNANKPRTKRTSWDLSGPFLLFCPLPDSTAPTRTFLCFSGPPRGPQPSNLLPSSSISCSGKRQLLKLADFGFITKSISAASLHCTQADKTSSEVCLHIKRTQDTSLEYSLFELWSQLKVLWTRKPKLVWSKKVVGRLHILSSHSTVLWYWHQKIFKRISKNFLVFGSKSGEDNTHFFFCHTIF